MVITHSLLNAYSLYIISILISLLHRNCPVLIYSLFLNIEPFLNIDSFINVRVLQKSSHLDIAQYLIQD